MVVAVVTVMLGVTVAVQAWILTEVITLKVSIATLKQSLKDSEKRQCDAAAAAYENRRIMQESSVMCQTCRQKVFVDNKEK